jgi:SAM-dependent methyltransferase
MVRQTNYEKIASTFDRRYQNAEEYITVEQVLLEFIGKENRHDVLEVGCGTGHWLSCLTQRGFNVTGLDFSRAMLDIALRQVPQSRLVHGTAVALPFAAASFDRVFCINAFHHFPDKEGFIVETRRVLKPGGGFLAIGLDPHTGLDRWWIYNYFPQSLEIDLQRYPAASIIRKMLKKHGFGEIISFESMHLPVRQPAAEALAKGLLDQSTTSQLAVLSDEEYNRGMEKLRQDIASAEGRQETLMIGADLRVYATTGWVK